MLADDISRWADRRDEFDLTLLLPPFTTISGAMRAFDMDACSDDLGNNSHSAKHWSSIDSALSHSWARRHVRCHPPLAIVHMFPRHFCQCFQLATTINSAMLLLPVCPSASSWILLRARRVCACCPAACRFITRPEWSLASRWCSLPRVRIVGAAIHKSMIDVLFFYVCPT